MLATEPLDKVTGLVTYSQTLLKQYGVKVNGRGIGFERKGSGYSLISRRFAPEKENVSRSRIVSPFSFSITRLAGFAAR